MTWGRGYDSRYPNIKFPMKMERDQNSLFLNVLLVGAWTTPWYMLPIENPPTQTDTEEDEHSHNTETV
jgi:hypothetical protein